MQANKTVSINGRLYDAVTGLPVTAKSMPKPAATKSATSSSKKRTDTVAATTVHAAPQRSKTLHRRATKKPGLPKRPQPGRHMDIARSASVARFAKHPVAAPVKETSTPDKAPVQHPVATRALAKVSAKTTKPVISQTPKQIKDAAISAALSAPKSKPAKTKRTFKISRRFIVVTGIFALLIVGAAITYLSIPNLSVSIAAAQAGVQASYPEYKPDGFSLSQPVTFSDGEVVLVFKSHSGAGQYSITQERSSWDSTAVLNNVVKKAAGDNYITTQERGLTIYSYDGNAAWVNGGILYTIETDAPLSGEQIRRIATSL